MFSIDVINKNWITINIANHSNRRFSRIHKITPMLLNIYEGDINPETKGRDFSISKIVIFFIWFLYYFVLIF